MKPKSIGKATYVESSNVPSSLLELCGMTPDIKTNCKHVVVILHAHFRLVSTLMFYLYF